VRLIAQASLQALSQMPETRGLRDLLRMISESSLLNVCGSSSVGRASAFQAECRGFESRLPLHTTELDRLAVKIFNHFTSSTSRRGEASAYFKIPLGLSYRLSNYQSLGLIEVIYTVKTSKNITEPDNVGFCLSCDDFSQIELITLVPPGLRTRSLILDEKFRKDFLNLIRHEIEHAFQSGAFALQGYNLFNCLRSEENFLLDPYEIPAYVHGFRISSSSFDDFKLSIYKFINDHASHIGLSEDETIYTFNVWKNYLKT
jgi:hypothetical protein